MLSSTTLSYFFGFWFATYLVDAGLSSHPYTRQKYLEFRERSGISIHILQAKFFTQKLNPYFERVGEANWFPWNLWFYIGTAFSAVFMLLSVVILFFLAYNTIMRKPIEQQVLTPVMPGVNLPMSQLGFYLLTLLVCVLLHEAGHALAAFRERVRIHGVGFFLVGIYPGAYVDISDSDLNSLSPIRQLKIYSAGVWHNGVIVILSILCFYTLPWLLSPAYIVNQGVGIVNLQQNSVFTGPRGLHLGDAITRVNSCPVNNPTEWFRCLEEANTKATGYCVPANFIDQHPLPPAAAAAAADNSPGLRHLAAVVLPPVAPEQQKVPQGSNEAEDDLLGGEREAQPLDCCPPHLASTHLCFTHMASGINTKRPKRACLPARAVTEKEVCLVPSDCGRVGGGGGGSGAGASVCLVPAPADSAVRLVRLAVVSGRSRFAPSPSPHLDAAAAASAAGLGAGGSPKATAATSASAAATAGANGGGGGSAVLFLGPVEELVAAVEVSDFVPRFPAITPARLPDTIATFCRYLFSLSGALVMFNVVPCYALDGQGIFKSLLDLALPSCVCSRQIRRLIFSTTLWLGTALVCLNILLALSYLLL